MKPMHILVLAGTVFDLASFLTCSGGRNDSSRRHSHRTARGGEGLERKAHNSWQPVYNDNKERVGTVDDIIVTPDKAISYAIVNAGGFLGLAKHNVAIPVSQFKLVDKKLVLPGVTKDALKASPEFQYAR
jgi:sporulation protein YlmC with PRC-barrel domain